MNIPKIRVGDTFRFPSIYREKECLLMAVSISKRMIHVLFWDGTTIPMKKSKILFLRKEEKI